MLFYRRRARMLLIAANGLTSVQAPEGGKGLPVGMSHQSDATKHQSPVVHATGNIYAAPLGHEE